MDEQTKIRIIMGYLKDKGFIESLIHLEKQSNVYCETYSKEILFLRKVITDGDFKEAINFLEPFETKLTEKDFKIVIMAIHRQRLFQLIENPDEVELRQLLERDLLPWCTEEEYQQLFQCLTLKSMKQLPGFQKWTIYKGRLNCFQTIKPYVELIQSQRFTKDAPQPRLEDIFSNYFNRSHHEPDHSAELTLNPFQQQPFRQQSNSIKNPSSLQQRKKQQPDKRFLYPKIDQYDEPYSNKFPSRPISQKDNFTFSEGKKINHTFKLKLLSSVIDERAIRVCQFSHDGKLFALGTNSSYLKIFNVADIFDNSQPKSQLDMVYQIQGLHAKSIFSLDWTANKRLMVTCSNDATVKLTRFNSSFKSHETSTIGRHQGCIRMVRFDSFGTKVASCAQDSLVKLWDVQKSKQLLNLKGHTSNVNALKIDSTNIFSVSKDSTIRMWDIRSGTVEIISKPSNSEMTYIARGTQNHVVSHKNGNVSFYNQSLQLTNSVKIHQSEIRSVQGLLDDNLLITSSFDGKVCILKLEEDSVISKQYHQHNQLKQEDKVVHAVFNRNLGFASSSNLGVCNIYAMI